MDAGIIIESDCEVEKDKNDIVKIDEDLFIKRQVSNDDNLLGRVVSNEEEAFALYNNYALGIGFSVRKGKVRYSAGSKNVKQREYVCSKQGFKLDDISSENKMVNRLDTRTGCAAFIRFTVEKDVWKVTRFIPTHNHELASVRERHLLRSGRNISNAKAAVINTMVNAGIRTKDAFSFLSEEHGGFENIGFTKRDCYNHVNKQKLMKIDAGDAQSLMNYFKRKKAEDPMFFYAVQVDQKNRMTNFFWRDGQARIDYDCFGDVVSFDTTYRTNKYNLICAPFVGVNHHWQNVLFGCAFLLDEKIDSFKWLFQSFLESMGNRPPITIFTDQDSAMSNAIKVVFPTTHHRLCLWHISKNAPSHFGSLNSNPEFQKLWKKCCTGCESVIEFQETWDEMIRRYDISDNNWFNLMYTVREKWSTVFTKGSFTAGIKSSQRSESTNNLLTGIANITTSLTHFSLAYENIVAGLRSKELDEDFRCKQGKPVTAVKYSGILEHAVKIYTCKMYMLFEKEFLHSLATLWREVTNDGLFCTYEVKEEANERVHMVHFNIFNHQISCTCKKFESKGILCSHALRVFSVRNVTSIPNQYILKRWTKEAKRGMMLYEKNIHFPGNKEEVELVWRHSMMRIASNLIYKCQGNDSTRQMCQEGLMNLEVKLDRQLARLKLGEAHVDDNDDHGNVAKDKEKDEMPLLDPPHARPKGVRNARIKGHFEKRKTKSSTKISSTNII
ncbi:hypothetical protein GH714_001308 [Hevea brasiliensis]|uniref:SWIM-type domain-containing protein n=1 Tax=Hevea brasiliensis TaxID=3981 RepID=A0A6A6L9I4_HEVBR|nr:hypothetical protein GH714_001308 [Hevea brasiliensis]